MMQSHTKGTDAVTALKTDVSQAVSSKSSLTPA